LIQQQRPSYGPSGVLLNVLQMQYVVAGAESACIFFLLALACMFCVATATRGRNAMRKAVMGSTSAFVMTRVNCASLIVKPQVSMTPHKQRHVEQQQQQQATPACNGPHSLASDVQQSSIGWQSCSQRLALTNHYNFVQIVDFCSGQR
jgi:hypothetical protein